MSNYSGILLGLMVENFRDNGTFNAASAQEIVKDLAKTNLSATEISKSFSEMMDTAPFTETSTHVDT